MHLKTFSNYQRRQQLSNEAGHLVNLMEPLTKHLVRVNNFKVHHKIILHLSGEQMQSQMTDSQLQAIQDRDAEIAQLEVSYPPSISINFLPFLGRHDERE